MASSSACCATPAPRSGSSGSSQVDRYLERDLRVTTALTEAPDADVAFQRLLPDPLRGARLGRRHAVAARELRRPPDPRRHMDAPGQHGARAAGRHPRAHVRPRRGVARARLAASGEPVVIEELWNDPRFLRRRGRAGRRPAHRGGLPRAPRRHPPRRLRAVLPDAAAGAAGAARGAGQARAPDRPVPRPAARGVRVARGGRHPPAQPAAPPPARRSRHRAGGALPAGARGRLRRRRHLRRAAPARRPVDGAHRRRVRHRRGGGRPHRADPAHRARGGDGARRLRGGRAGRGQHRAAARAAAGRCGSSPPAAWSWSRTATAIRVERSASPATRCRCSATGCGEVVEVGAPGCPARRRCRASVRGDAGRAAGRAPRWSSTPTASPRRATTAAPSSATTDCCGVLPALPPRVTPSAPWPPSRPRSRRS